MIIFGKGTSNIGHLLITNSVCNYCGQEETQVLTIFGNYAHIFWVPFFPLGRDGLITCTHCKYALEQKEFSPELNQVYLDNKSQVKRPLWHWTGIGLMGILIVLTFFIG